MDADTKRKMQMVIGFSIFLIAVIASYFSVIEGDEKTNCDVILTLDISGSMRDSSKLEAVKKAAIEFINVVLLQHNTKFRIGLVIFQTQARKVCQLTNDVNKLESEISKLEADGNTAMGDAIKVATDILKSDTRPGTSKTILLMTDGRSNEGIDPITATKEVKQYKIIIYTVGYGDDADITILEKIASTTGGEHYFAMTGNELVKVFSQIAAILISPIVHYGSRTLILLSMPILLFLPEIEKGVTTIVQKATTTIFRRTQPTISRPVQKVPRRPERTTRMRPTETIQRVFMCPSCEHVNRSSAAFCAKCGASLKLAAPETRFCGQCGHENRATAQFCAKCGHQLRKEQR